MRKPFIGIVILSLSAFPALAGIKIGKESRSYENDILCSDEAIVAPDNNNNITVLGKGVVRVKPDYATFSIDLISWGDTVEISAKMHEERLVNAFKLFETLEKEGVIIQIASTAYTDYSSRKKSSADAGLFSKSSLIPTGTTFILQTNTLDALKKIVSQVANAGIFLPINEVKFYAQNNRDFLDKSQKEAALHAERQAFDYAESVEHSLGKVEYLVNYGSRLIDNAVSVITLSDNNVHFYQPSEITYYASVRITRTLLPKSVEISEETKKEENALPGRIDLKLTYEK